MVGGAKQGSQRALLLWGVSGPERQEGLAHWRPTIWLQRLQAGRGGGGVGWGHCGGCWVAAKQGGEAV